VKPAAFDYACPETLEEALDLLERHGDAARVIAGGQSLSAMLNMRLATARLLIDISQIGGLKTIAVRDGAVEVGAGVTQEELLRWPELAAAQPLLSLMLPWIGHYQTRTRGTVCGSIAHADPSAEMPLALAHLAGEVVLQARRGQRRLAAAEFQTGMMATAIEPGEMLTACRFPVAAPGAASAFREISQRHGDFALVAVAATGDGNGVRLGVGGVAEVPTTIDLPWLAAAQLDEALNDFAWALGGSDDLHASARYRRELVRKVGAQAIAEVRDAVS
jgi:2-furoyl-CoA dehydrogenase FAD binding subunit